jgi:hypothetical protein
MAVAMSWYFLRLRTRGIGHARMCLRCVGLRSVMAYGVSMHCVDVLGVDNIIPTDEKYILQIGSSLKLTDDVIQ